MDFMKKLKTRRNVAISYGLIGILFTALFFTDIMKSEYILTLGIAFIVMGIFRLVQYKRITKDEQSVLRRKTEEYDERNVSIIRKSRSAAFTLYVFITAVAVIVLQLLGKSELSSILGLNVCAIVLLYWICYVIYHKIS